MEADIRYFEANNQLGNERIHAGIECLNEDNPFPGTLILTNLRLVFLRSQHVGKQSRFIRFRSIRNISTYVEDSFKLMFVVELPSTQQRFELKGPSFAMKQDFVERVQCQLLSKTADTQIRKLNQGSSSSGNYNV